MAAVGAKPLARPAPVRAAGDIAALLAHEGPDFIRCAYLTLLGRKPDASGRDSATVFMRRGGCKIDLIRSLARSKEGRELQVKLPGLAAALRQRALGRVLLLGQIIEPLLETERTGRPHRQERAIVFAATDLYERISIRIQRIEELAARGEINSPSLLGQPAGESNATPRFREILRRLRARLI